MDFIFYESHESVSKILVKLHKKDFLIWIMNPIKLNNNIWKYQYNANNQDIKD